MKRPSGSAGNRNESERSNVNGIMPKWIEPLHLSTVQQITRSRAKSVIMFLLWKKHIRIRIFLHGRPGLEQKQIGMTPQSQKKTNFLAGGSTKRVKRAKALSTRDTGGKAEVCAPPDLDRIVVQLSMLNTNYYKYIYNNG